MTPLMLRTAALEVAKGALVHPFFRVRLVNDVAALANWAPSSEVKHWALEKFPACTVTTPLGAMNRRPLVALHRSTGMKTFLRVSGVSALTLVACAAPAPRMGRMTAVAHKAPVAICRSRVTCPHFPWGARAVGRPADMI